MFSHKLRNWTLPGVGIALLVCVGGLLARNRHAAVSRAKSTAGFSIDAIKQHAWQHWQRGEYEAFIAELEQVPAEAPDKARALMEQGRGYWELCRSRDMERVLAQCLALERNPDRPSEATIGAWATLGDHYIGQERFEETRDVVWKAFDAGAKAGHPDPFFLMLLLRTRFESAEPALALEKLNRYLAYDAEDYNSHRSIGIYLARIGKLAEARGHLQRAVSGMPHTPWIIESWLWYLFETGDAANAEKVLRALPSEFENRAEFWVYRGKAADIRADWKAAIDCYTRALEIEPKRMDANNRLAQALRNAGQLDAFELQIQRCKELGGAFRELAGLYATRRNIRETPPSSAQCARIAELCRILGWEREADAWKKVEAVVP